MHSITGKLNKPAKQFQAGESVGFGIRLGVKYRDPKTKQDEWTNYQAAIFAKSPNQIQFYQSALVEGAIVEISAEQLKVYAFDGQNGQILTIEMLNARLGYVHSPQGQAPQQGGYSQPQQPQRPNQAAPSNYNQVPHAQQLAQQPVHTPAQQTVQEPGQPPAMDSFDDSIPF